MHRNLQGARVVITGASSGIGKAAALEFARRGADVSLMARRLEPLRDVARDCRAQGVRALAIEGDVRHEEDVEEFTRLTLENLGGIDVWVNNAGVSAFGLMEETDPEVGREVIETDLFGTINGTRAAIRHFKSRGEGTVINVASIAGKVGFPYQSHYCAAKHGIVGFSEAVRAEHIDNGSIRICVIEPGPIDTPFWQHAANYTGRAIKAIEPVYDVQQAALAIVDTAEDPVSERIVGNSARMMLAMRRLMPSLTWKMMKRQMDSSLFQDRREGATTGSVDHPMAEGVSTGGGWRQSQGGMSSMAGSVGGLSAATATAVALGLGWWLWRRAGHGERPDERPEDWMESGRGGRDFSRDWGINRRQRGQGVLRGRGRDDWRYAASDLGRTGGPFERYGQGLHEPGRARRHPFEGREAGRP